MKATYKKDPKLMHELFTKAVKSYTERKFNYYLAELNKLDSRAHKYFTQIMNVNKWASCKPKDNRRATVTSNNAETLNSPNNAARQLPVTALIRL